MGGLSVFVTFDLFAFFHHLLKGLNSWTALIETISIFSILFIPLILWFCRLSVLLCFLFSSAKELFQSLRSPSFHLEFSVELSYCSRFLRSARSFRLFCWLLILRSFLTLLNPFISASYSRFAISEVIDILLAAVSEIKHSSSLCLSILCQKL